MKPQPESGLLGFPRAGDYSGKQSSYQQNVRCICHVHYAFVPQIFKKNSRLLDEAIKYFPLHTTHELAVPSSETNLSL